LRVRTSKKPVLALLVLVTVVLAAGCQVTTDVVVQVESDGSGVVEVVVSLDDDALARVPDVAGDRGTPEEDLADLLRTADLEAAGWEVEGPQRDADLTLVRLRQPFGTPEEATAVLASLAPEGVMAGPELNRSTSFGFDEFAFSGVADLGEGLEAFSDAGVAEVLGGAPLGEDPDAVEERAGGSLGDVFVLGVQVSLPGGVDEAWTAELGGPAVMMEASSTVQDVPVLAAAALAVVCLLALLALFTVRLVRGRRW
jgi:hypothetical protein